MPIARRSAAFVAALALTAAVPGRAAARDAHTTLLLGPIFALGGETDVGKQWSAGGELSLAHRFGKADEDVTFNPGLGVLVQAESVDATHLRLAGGLELIDHLFGVELALSREWADASHGNSLGLQVAPFVSLGVVAISLRAVVPFQERGLSVVAVLSLKLPIGLDGEALALRDNLGGR